jgi:predicted RND superfamily exporter protein
LTNLLSLFAARERRRRIGSAFAYLFLAAFAGFVGFMSLQFPVIVALLRF